MFTKTVIGVTYNGKVWCVDCARRHWGRQLATRSTDDARDLIQWITEARMGAHCAQCGALLSEVQAKRIPAYMTAEDVLDRYARLVAHVICASGGYASPRVAALIVQDAHLGRSNYCEWVAGAYGGSARAAVRQAIQERATHQDYPKAYKIVQEYRVGSTNLIFRSW